MMSVATLSHDITIIRGITHDPELIVFLNPAKTQVDIQSGWKVYAQVRKKPHKAIVRQLDPIILPVGTVLGYDGEEDGPGRVKLAEYTDEETLAMTDAKLYWDVVLEDPSGQRTGPYVAGQFNIITIITEPE